MARIDHLIQAFTANTICHGSAFSIHKNAFIEYRFESSDNENSPKIMSIHAGLRVYAGTTSL